MCRGFDPNRSVLRHIGVCSSLLVKVETSFRIGSYSELAMMFILVAAIGSIWLMVQILRQDEHASGFS